jgi:hypothetical protein
MGKKKGVDARGRGSSMQGQAGGSKTLPHDQKQTVSAVDEGEGTPSTHKCGDLNSTQNVQGLHQTQEADPSGSDLQIGTGMKHSGESERKELTPGGSFSTAFELSDIWHCNEFRVIVREMMDTHPQKDYYAVKMEEHNSAHAMGHCKMSDGPSGEQKSDIQSCDFKSGTENQSVDYLPAEVSCSHVFI